MTGLRFCSICKMIVRLDILFDPPVEKVCLSSACILRCLNCSQKMYCFHFTTNSEVPNCKRSVYAHLATPCFFMAGGILDLFSRTCFLIPFSTTLHSISYAFSHPLPFYLLMRYSLSTRCALSSAASFHPASLIFVYFFIVTSAFIKQYTVVNGSACSYCSFMDD